MPTTNYHWQDYMYRHMALSASYIFLGYHYKSKEEEMSNNKNDTDNIEKDNNSSISKLSSCNSSSSSSSSSYPTLIVHGGFDSTLEEAEGVFHSIPGSSLIISM